MDDIEIETDAGGFTPQAVAAACVVMARFIQTQHPEFGAYLQNSLAGALASGLSNSDLALIRLLVRSLVS